MKTELRKRIVPALQTYGLAVAISLTTLGTAFAQSFTRITTGAIATDVGVSWTASWGDFNNDGFEDLFVANNSGQNDCLYLNDGQGGFTAILTGDIVNDGTDSSAGVWGDYDNDGYLDLMVTVNTYPIALANMLYRNQGDGTFSKVTSGSIVTDVNFGMQTCAWGDYDNDGHIDMFVANDGFTSDAQRKDFLYRNDGAGGFTRILSGPMVNDSGNGTAGTWGDYNNDGTLDLFVSNLFDQKNFLYRNDGNGVFAKITTGDIVNDVGNFAGGSWGDYNNDGFLDLFVSNFGEWGSTATARNLLYRNTGNGSFVKVTSGAIVTDSAKFTSNTWGDYDNDGFLDLFVCEYQPGNNFLYRNNGDGTFSRITTGDIVNDGGDSYAGAFADYDNDGFLDLFVANINGQANFLYHNDGNTNQWLKIKCVGGPSNRAAIGAKVRVQAQNSVGALTWQVREISGGGVVQNSLIAHFGLGGATNAQTVRIEWPSGIVQTLTNVAAKQLLTVTEPPLLQAGLTNGSLRLLLTGSIGLAYEVESSTNLVEWTSLGTITNTTRTMQFVDSVAANQPQRFYRAVLK